jgi:hypothetical protein
MQAEIDTQGGDADEAEFDEPLGAEGAGDQSSGGEAALSEAALLGARHDLALAGESLAPTCTCLAVVAGFPSNPAFFWHSIVPTISPESQIVIAFTSEGVSCDKADQGGLGASYWGYRKAGRDVIVYIENAAPGRPVTTGAIIPRPIGGGAIYVEPREKNVPYGLPLDGSGKRCRVPVSTPTQRAVPAPPGTSLE